MNAIASLVLGWGVDRYNWPRTYVLAAANLLLSGMYILEVSILKGAPHQLQKLRECHYLLDKVSVADSRWDVGIATYIVLHMQSPSQVREHHLIAQ